MNTWNHQNGK